MRKRLQIFCLLLLPCLTLMGILGRGSPAALSWLGGVRGQRVRPLGVNRFGQTGSLPDLYAHHGLDADAVVDAAARALT